MFVIQILYIDFFHTDMISDFEHNRYLFSQNYFIILEMYNAKIKAAIRYSTTKTTT